jgi:hypothetical protein
VPRMRFTYRRRRSLGNKTPLDLPRFRGQFSVFVS